jgi:hypothetical protein
MDTHAITPQVVALVIKKAARRVGLDAAALAGHSLRSGLCTTAARNGATERAIMKQTGHRSVQMVRRYIREAELFSDNAATKLGFVIKTPPGCAADALRVRRSYRTLRPAPHGEEQRPGRSVTRRSK